MKKIIIYILLAFFFIPFETLFSQEAATITGRILMPVIRKERRTFRGRLYRNRLASSRKSKSENKVLKTSFIDVIVSAHPLSFRPKVKPLTDVKVLQRNAEFIPRVIPITPGSSVQFINRDRFFHNVFSITPGAKFNIGRKPTGWVTHKKIKKLGEVKLFCDIHAQMNAAIISLNTPYFTRVEPNGEYSLKGLPEGQYELRTYHPDLPSMFEVVEIKKGEVMHRNFNLTR
jgi:plastocyanin